VDLLSGQGGFDPTTGDAARAIWQVEREQASRIAAGETLRAQTSFDEYLSRRANDLSYTLRQHLRQIGGAIEE
jgi:hypothetical protein